MNFIIDGREAFTDYSETKTIKSARSASVIYTLSVDSENVLIIADFLITCGKLRQSVFVVHHY